MTVRTSCFVKSGRSTESAQLMLSSCAEFLYTSHDEAELDCMVNIVASIIYAYLHGMHFSAA